MIKRILLGLVGAVVLSPFPAIASLADAEVVFSSGGWNVLRSVDGFTDKVTCTGILGEDFGIQLTSEKLYVRVSGGIKGIQARLDDDEPLPMYLPSDIEKRIGSVIIDVSNVDRLGDRQRLRLQVVTLVKGVQLFDIPLTGAADAVQNIRSGCPSPETNGSTPRQIPANP